MLRGLSSASPAAAGSHHGSIIPSVAYKTLSFPYHTVSAESLAKRTAQRLIECGIPRAVLARCVGKRVTLPGCVSLNAQGYATLPPALGGYADHFHASPATYGKLRVL